jgi:hypothetical protein
VEVGAVAVEEVMAAEVAVAHCIILKTKSAQGWGQSEVSYRGDNGRMTDGVGDEVLLRAALTVVGR